MSNDDLDQDKMSFPDTEDDEAHHVELKALSVANCVSRFVSMSYFQSVLRY